MKRYEKLALLTKVVQGNITEHTRQQLRQSVDYGPIIAIIRVSCDGPKPEDEIWIQEENQKISMLYSDLETYAARKENSVIFIFPDNGRG